MKKILQQGRERAGRGGLTLRNLVSTGLSNCERRDLGAPAARAPARRPRDSTMLHGTSLR